ncbi:hypothetical protein N7510_009153, partial [Penicillium lagena]|uniref:uncharacterized protein n=1 Tax=Penicillium lagena TaxID=94218 RepID=UPI002542206F
MEPQTILITGCSAHGIGAALAHSLAKRGHHIFATARSPSKIPSKLASLSNVTVVPLDVTDPTTISAAVRAVLAHGQGLDVLINNAGAGYTIPLLDADLDLARQVYEANVWGPLRLVQGFADLLIQSRGRVVNVSSVGAAVNTPWIGVYSSSKSAITQISETLRLELGPLGVDVVCLMVGTVTTTFHANEPEVILPPSSRYMAIRETISNWAMGRAGPKGCSAEEFAESVVNMVVSSNHGGGLIWKGPYSTIIRFVPKWCPTWLL